MQAFTLQSCFYHKPLAALLLLLAPLYLSAQDDSLLGIDAVEIPEARLPLCFGFSDVTTVSYTPLTLTTILLV